MPRREGSTCYICKERPIGSRGGMCNRCSNARMVNRAREIILTLKLKTCADCGQQFPPHLMDFDHITDDKGFNLSVAMRRATGYGKLVAEIRKCEVVCTLCHRHRTHTRRKAGGKNNG